MVIDCVAKNGLVDFNQVSSVASHVVSSCPNLKLNGLMTIGSSEWDNSRGNNPDFLVHFPLTLFAVIRGRNSKISGTDCNPLWD